MYWLLSFIVCILCNNFCFIVAVCPHDGQLDKWSDSSTWGFKKPLKNDNVTITKPILLDENPPELFSITIEDGGRLVWSPSKDIDLRVHYILIKGRMDIGSEDCKYPAKATITLIGERGDYDISGFNEKFIGVAANGTLELHGQYKLPWTKLTKTLNKFEFDTGLIFRHQDQDGIKRGIAGVQVHVFDPVTGKMEKNGLFRLIYRKETNFQSALSSMITFLEEIPDGKVVAMAAQRSIIKHDLTKLIEAVEELAYGYKGDSYFRQLDKNGAWAMVTVKGDASSTNEVLDENTGEESQQALAKLILLKNKRKFEVSSYIHNKKLGRSEVDFIVTDTDYSMPILDVVDDVTTWKPGDTVLLTSTDYNWKQAEMAPVISCSSCTSNQVRVEFQPKYTHYGEIYKNVDMRGEVALITHNIKIQGETTDEKQFGGHTKYLKGFKNVHIEGVEFTNMGQQTDLGRYPVHFHMCEDVDTYDNPPYIRQNTIHHTFARCTTIHGTHGVKLSDNVCFDTLGHGYFLEDGGEKRIVFEGNLGAGQRKGGLIPADSIPTTFWITNPQTRLRNNVAAGGEGRGFWMVYPDIPVGPSSTLGFMAEFEARHTALYEFYNNVAHSYMVDGLFIDNILQPNNTAKGYNMYRPWRDPLDENSGPHQVNLTKFTGYKCKRNAWVRGGLFKLSQFSLSDSVESLNLLRENPQEQYFTNSVIIGDSENIGEPTVYRENGEKLTYQRSLPNSMKPFLPRQGVRFQNGPVYISNTWFGGFKDTELYPAGAITMKNSDVGRSTARNTASGLQFGFADGINGGNRVRDVNDALSFLDEDHIATFRDLDGSVSSVPGSQIVPVYPFFMTPSCVVRTNWNLASCPYTYGVLRIKYGKKGKSVYATRDDDPDATDVDTETDNGSKFLVILDGVHSYTISWGGDVPDTFVISGYGVTRSDTIRVGVCVPRNATFTLMSSNLPSKVTKMKDWTEVDSLDEVDSDTNGAKYFYDSDVGILFFKLIHQYEMSSDDKNDCPDEECVRIRVKIDSGDVKDSNCTSRAYPKYKTTIPTEQSRVIRKRRSVLPATSPDPPQEWGAGSTKPFVPEYIIGDNLK